MISDNPLHDWANHVHAMDNQSLEYDHVCDSCHFGFNKGSQFDTEKFCHSCLEQHKHVEYYQNLEIPDNYIFEILNTEVKL